MSDGKPAPNERQATRRIDTAGPDYGKPTGPVGRFRARLRVFLENLKVEFFTMGVVIIYMLLIFTDLMLADDPKVDSEAKGKPWTNTFKYVDMVFLSIFTAELLIRLFAFGYFYCLAPLNTVDGLVVLISFGLQAWLGSGVALTLTLTLALSLSLTQTLAPTLTLTLTLALTLTLTCRPKEMSTTIPSTVFRGARQ